MQGFSFVGDVQVANGTWSSLVTLRHVLLPQINACDEPKERLLGFKNYYSWTLFPESAIGPTITSVYFFIDSMTALVLVDFNCVSDQRLYNIYKMFLLERLFSICRRNHFEDDLFSPSPPLWISNWFDGSTWKRGDAKKSQSEACTFFSISRWPWLQIELCIFYKLQEPLLNTLIYLSP